MATTPRLRPMRSAEEMAKVPLDQPILVEIPGMPTGEETPVPEPAAKADGKAEAREAAPPTDNDPVKQLTTQVEELKKAAKYNEEALARSEKMRREAASAAQRAALEVETSRQSNVATEHELVSSALVSAQNELAAAKAAAKAAGEASDFAAQADAHDKIADARSKINQYEGALASIEQQIKSMPQPGAPQPQQPVDVNESIDQMAALLPREREYLKQHPELVLDAGLNNELSVAHNRALRQGIKRNSDQYFTYMDDFLGYKEQAKSQDTQDIEDNGAMVSAPVSRQSQGNSSRPGTPDRVTLTPEQREMARSMGVTDLQYAEQVLRMQQDKIENPEKYAIRR